MLFQRGVPGFLQLRRVDGDGHRHVLLLARPHAHRGRQGETHPRDVGACHILRGVGVCPRVRIVEGDVAGYGLHPRVRGVLQHAERC